MEPVTRRNEWDSRANLSPRRPITPRICFQLADRISDGAHGTLKSCLRGMCNAYAKTPVCYAYSSATTAASPLAGNTGFPAALRASLEDKWSADNRSSGNAMLKKG